MAWGITASEQGGAQTSSLVTTLTRIGVTTWLGLLPLVTVDALVVAWRSGAPLVLLLGYSGYGLLLAAPAALFCAGLLGALGYVGRGLLTARVFHERRGLRDLVGALGWGALGAAFVAFLLRVWEPHLDPYHLGMLGPAASGAGVVGLRWSAPRVPAHLYAVGCLVLAGGFFTADLLVLRGLYLTLHNVVAFGAAVCSVHAVAVLAPRLGRVRPWLALAVLVAACVTAFVATEGRSARELGSIHGAMLPKLVAATGALADRDRDGFAPGFGGDCDDTDAEVHPGACEIAGNGRDDNCNQHVDTTRAQSRTPRRASPALRDVYLIVVDALRADYGGRGRARMAPNLERFAARALDFQHAYTPYPSTYRAMIAMSTSRSYRHRDDRVLPMFSWFRAAGYDSQLWIGTRVLRDQAGKPTLGPDRSTGDPFVVEAEGKLDWSTNIIDRALTELRDAPDAPPRVRWLHLLDTHAPLVRAATTASGRERYEAEVAFVDRELGRLFEGLERHPRGARAAVVVLADHGEELGEHGGFFHGAMLWESSVRVPMILRLPGVPPRRIVHVASLLDMLPTLAHHLGLEALPAWQGHDWLERDIRGPRVVSQVAALDNLGGAGLPARVGVTDGRLKLIVNVDEQLVDVFNLERDPGERRNLGGERNLPGRRALEQALVTWEDLDGCVQ